MNLRLFNLNLLVILDVLLETRNVTAAANKLGLTQPAISSALAKLREAFVDELLAPVGRELQLTPKAQELKEPVRALLANAEAIFEDRKFDPLRWKDEFVIATADYMSVVLLPHLIKATSEGAPDLVVRFTNLNRDATSLLKTDQVDMIIAPISLINDPGLMSRHLFSDRFVCVCHRDHAIGDKGLTLEDYLSRTHVTSLIDMHYPTAERGTSSKEIDDLRAAQKSAAQIPFYLALPFVVANTNLFALVQERLVNIFADSLPITYFDSPVPISPLKFAMFWNPRRNKDAAHRWMRETIFDICQAKLPD